MSALNNTISNVLKVIHDITSSNFEEVLANATDAKVSATDAQNAVAQDTEATSAEATAAANAAAIAANAAMNVAMNAAMNADAAAAALKQQVGDLQKAKAALLQKINKIGPGKVAGKFVHNPHASKEYLLTPEEHSNFVSSNFQMMSNNNSFNVGFRMLNDEFISSYIFNPVTRFIQELGVKNNAVKTLVYCLSDNMVGGECDGAAFLANLDPTTKAVLADKTIILPYSTVNTSKITSILPVNERFRLLTGCLNGNAVWWSHNGTTIGAEMYLPTPKNAIFSQANACDYMSSKDIYFIYGHYQTSDQIAMPMVWELDLKLTSGPKVSISTSKIEIPSSSYTITLINGVRLLNGIVTLYGSTGTTSFQNKQMWYLSSNNNYKALDMSLLQM